MKRLFVILSFLIYVMPAKAQIQATELHLLEYDYTYKWRFGITLGAHILDFSIKNSGQQVFIPDLGDVFLTAETTTTGIGFNINGIVDYRIVRNLHLRSGFGLCFGERTLSFFQNRKTFIHSMRFDSYYIDIPLLVKYSANRHSNFRPYIIAGMAARYNLGGKSNETKARYLSLSPLEAFYEAGFGFDWFYYYFKLSFEIKYSRGFTDALSNKVTEGYEGYRDAISRMNSHMIIFSFHFE